MIPWPLDGPVIAQDERIRTIGHVLVLLTPWDDAQYFQRRWCVAEPLGSNQQIIS